MKSKAFIRKLLPAWLLGIYHWVASFGAVIIYGWPARSLLVVGVTGTKGKTTTANMIWHILQSAGLNTGLISTAQVAIGQEVKLNDLKMTMPSRFKLQRLFRQMVRANCRYVVVETSSEGLAQWRHLGIPYRLAVFTNLSPEHIESHGSYVNYRAAKGKLFARLASLSRIKKDLTFPVTAIINLDDAAADYFLHFKVKRRWGYSLRSSSDARVSSVIRAQVDNFDLVSARIRLPGQALTLAVGGEFNIYNALAAVSVGLALGLPLPVIIQALEKYRGTPGRMEFVEQGQPFRVVVDYAHTANSLEQVYKTLKPYGRLLAVLGACGGGRDKAKRPVLGQLAAEQAAKVWITNEDPYDENPEQIMAAVAAGAEAFGKVNGQDLFIVSDRRRAISEALKAAGSGDIVVITGKGSEQWLCVADNQKIPWDDRLVVKEELARIGFSV
ncbi:MAG: UDP-N-acetylmuramyl-tripeptide synthetase [Candidatus Kerfeldbacteria bacterium]|nr:UDP-N-acetylmuramyl-tripeptide synthetase [Candidatus Kerfeldbacteria bacterium]